MVREHHQGRRRWRRHHHAAAGRPDLGDAQGVARRRPGRRGGRLGAGGAGDPGSGRAFCVGQDLAEHVESLRGNAATSLSVVEDEYNPLVLALAGLRVPVVVGINGACAGAGLGIALAGDLRVAAAGAKFTTAFTGIGLSSDSALAGTARAQRRPFPGDQLLLLPEPFTRGDGGAVGARAPGGGTGGQCSTEASALAARLAENGTTAGLPGGEDGAGVGRYRLARGHLGPGGALADPPGRRPPITARRSRRSWRSGRRGVPRVGRAHACTCRRGEVRLTRRQGDCGSAAGSRREPARGGGRRGPSLAAEGDARGTHVPGRRPATARRRTRRASKPQSVSWRASSTSVGRRRWSSTACHIAAVGPWARLRAATKTVVCTIMGARSASGAPLVTAPANHLPLRGEKGRAPVELLKHGAARASSWPRRGPPDRDRSRGVHRSGGARRRRRGAGDPRAPRRRRQAPGDR